MEVQKLFQCDLNQQLLTKVGPCALQIFFLAGYSMSFMIQAWDKKKKKRRVQNRKDLQKCPLVFELISLWGLLFSVLLSEGDSLNQSVKLTYPHPRHN